MFDMCMAETARCPSNDFVDHRMGAIALVLGTEMREM
jgi:hypothetical protein